MTEREISRMTETEICEMTKTQSLIIYVFLSEKFNMQHFLSINYLCGYQEGICLPSQKFERLIFKQGMSKHVIAPYFTIHFCKA